jgi:hypothetical protein
MFNDFLSLHLMSIFTCSSLKAGLYLSAQVLAFLYPMTQSKNSLALDSTRLSGLSLMKSRTNGTAKSTALVGMVKLKTVAYANRPPPTIKPSLGIGKLWLNARLKSDEMQGLMFLYRLSSSWVTYPTACFFLRRLRTIRSEL